MIKMLTVPVLLYVATMAVWIVIIPQFAPMVKDAVLYVAGPEGTTQW